MSFTSWLKDLFVVQPSDHKVSSSQAEPDELDEVDPFNPFPEPITIEIGDIIDLHTIPPRDVKRVVEEYLLEARAKGFSTLRIIHGKGVGVQREIVRSVLAKTTFVEEWKDAPPDAGGLGATIVRLTRSDVPKTT